VTNITFLAGSGAPTTALSAPEVARDAAGNAVASKGAQPAGSAVPAPAASPNAAFAIAPTATSALDTVRGAVGPTGPASPDEAQKTRSDQATAGPTGVPAAAAYNPQDTERSVAAAPQRSPLLNPWLWLGLAIVCAAAAIALQRRLRASV
jgi:hypothetical protein